MDVKSTYPKARSWGRRGRRIRSLLGTFKRLRAVVNGGSACNMVTCTRESGCTPLAVPQNMKSEIARVYETGHHWEDMAALIKS